MAPSLLAANQPTADAYTNTSQKRVKASSLGGPARSCQRYEPLGESGTHVDGSSSIRGSGSVVEPVGGSSAWGAQSLQDLSKLAPDSAEELSGEDGGAGGLFTLDV